MNIKHYEDIYNQFAERYYKMADNVIDYRPNSNIGIRITMRDGTKYDYDILSKGLCRVDENRVLKKDEITDEKCRESFAYHLHDLMVKKGYNQQTLSDYTGVSKGSINAYLNKSKTPSITNMRKIAYVLGCSIAELLD